MKILHLLDIPWWSGLSSYAFNSIEAHIQLGHKIQLACQEGSLPFKKGMEKGFELLPIGGRDSVHSFLNFFKIKRALRDPPHLILAHTGSTHWIAGILSKILNVPMIRTRATSQIFKSNSLSRFLYKQSYYVVCASQNLREHLLEQFPELDKKLLTVYPSIGTQEFKDRNSTETLKVGILARFDPVKGHTTFLKAAKKVQEEIPNVEFHLAGPEENISWSNLSSEIKNLKVKNCFYHGFLNEEKVFPWLESCTVGVIASEASEELSRAALEWMACGKPIVATRVGSIPELIENDRNGFVVEPKDPKAMAQSLIKILKSRELIQKFSLNNLQRHRDHFSIISAKKEWGKILESIPLK